MHESSIDKGLALAQDECKLENTELNNWLVCYMEREREREIILSSSEVKYDLRDQKYYISRDTCESEQRLSMFKKLYQ